MKRSFNFCWAQYLVLAFSCTFVGAQTAADYDSLVKQAQSQMNAGNNDKAVITAKSAIQSAPDKWEAYAVAGGALMNLKRFEEAADQFGHAIDHAPENKQAQLRDLRRKCVLAEVNPAQSTATPPAAQSPTTTQAEIVLWKTIENSTKIEDFKTYLTQYPNGAFATLAKERLEKVEQEKRRDFSLYGDLSNSVWTGSIVSGGTQFQTIFIFQDGGKLAWEGNDPNNAKLNDMKSQMSTLSRDAFIRAYSSRLNNHGTFEVNNGTTVKIAFSSANSSSMHCSNPFEGSVNGNTLVGKSHFVGDDTKEGRKCEKWGEAMWNLQRQYSAGTNP